MVFRRRIKGWIRRVERKKGAERQETRTERGICTLVYSRISQEA